MKFILGLIIGGLIAWLSEFVDPKLPRMVALLTLVIVGVLMFSLLDAAPLVPDGGSGEWLLAMPRFRSKGCGRWKIG